MQYDYETIFIESNIQNVPIFDENFVYVGLAIYLHTPIQNFVEIGWHLAML